MTEAEWLRATDATPMLEWLRTTSRASDRKLRLFAVACCQRVSCHMMDERSRQGVAVAERFVDGLAGGEELSLARKGTGEAWDAECGPCWRRYKAARAAHFACLPADEPFWQAHDEALGV